MVGLYNFHGILSGQDLLNGGVSFSPVGLVSGATYVGHFCPSFMATGLDAVLLHSPSDRFCFCSSAIEGRSPDTGSSC